MAFTRSRREVIQPFELSGAQMNAVCGSVLLDPGNSFGAGYRGNIVTLSQQPGQRHLRRRCTRFGSRNTDVIRPAAFFC